MSTTDVRSKDPSESERQGPRHEGRSGRHSRLGCRPREGVLRGGWGGGWTSRRPSVVQFTPHGSACSVQFGATLTSAAPGSAKGYLIVSDIEAARDALVAAGIEVSEVFHLGPDGPVSGPDPERRSYCSLRLVQRSRRQRAGCCRRSRPGFPGASTPPRRRSAPRATSRARSGVRRPPTASTRSAPARPTRTGRTGTPRTWWPSRPGRSCRRERLRRDRSRWRGARRALRRGDGGARAAGRRRRAGAGRRRVLLLGVHSVEVAVAPGRGGARRARGRRERAGRRRGGAGVAGLHGVGLFRRRAGALAGRPGHRPAARHGPAGRDRRGRGRRRPAHRGAHRRRDRLGSDRAPIPGLPALEGCGRTARPPG